MIRPIQSLLLGFLILTIQQSFAQINDDIWISSYVKETQKNKEVIDLSGEEVKMVKLDSIQTSFSYHELYLLLDFLDDNYVIIKGIGGKQLKRKYTIKRGKLKIRFDKGKIKGYVSENRIVFKEKTSKTSTKEIFFETLNESYLTDSHKLKDSFLENSNWTINANTNSNNYGTELQLLDNNELRIIQINEDYGYNNWGNWETDLYKNHLFLICNNLVRPEKRVYHFYRTNNDTLIGNTFEHSNFNKKPKLNNIKLSNNHFLNNTQLTLLESKLIGNWHAINNPIPFDPILGSDTLTNQKFEIIFDEDKKFSLLRSGTLTKDSVNSNKELKLNGNWKLDKSGKFIELIDEEKSTRLITISKLNENDLEMFYRIRALDGNLSSNRIIKMKKQLTTAKYNINGW